MFFPLAEAAPTSDDFARLLDIPISAVPSMIAAMPVVDPSAAMSKVVPGCSVLNCSASCGTSFAPSVSEPLITRRSALVVVDHRITVAAEARAMMAVFMRVWIAINFAILFASQSDNQVKSRCSVLPHREKLPGAMRHTNVERACG